MKGSHIVRKVRLESEVSSRGKVPRSAPRATKVKWRRRDRSPSTVSKAMDSPRQIFLSHTS